MITSFCSVLEAALDEASFAHQPRALEALLTSRRLQHRLELRRRLRDGSPLKRRIAAFSALIGKGAYSRRQRWNLGYRNVLADLRAVLGGA